MVVSVITFLNFIIVTLQSIFVIVTVIVNNFDFFVDKVVFFVIVNKSITICNAR